ncbi:MAG: YeeE/YedE thiosulfate transporter family protein [Verrucomicrobiota bacterium]
MRGGAILLAASLFVSVAPPLAGQTPSTETGSFEPLAYPGGAWSPYLAGGLIGVLAWFTMSLSSHAIGASSAYASVAGLAGRAIAPGKTCALPYYRDTPPRLNWSIVFVGAIIVGSALGAWSGDEWTGRWLPPIWEDRFGTGSLGLRSVVAFLGGMAMAFGARLAGGCTSGHGISGTLQLNLASWIALVCFFLGGMAVAFPLYRW